MKTKYSIWRLGLAVLFAASVWAFNASAALVVSGSNDTGEVGQLLTPTLTLSSDGTTDEVDLSQVESWVFRLDWGAAPLTFIEADSTITFGGVTRTLPDLYDFLDPNGDAIVSSALAQSSFEFDYYDFNFSDPTTLLPKTVDLSGGFEFTGHFTGAAAGSYPITFETSGLPSGLADSNFAEYTYTNVSTNQDPMQVTVTASTSPAVAEPGALALLAGGLLGLGFSHRRREG